MNAERLAEIRQYVTESHASRPGIQLSRELLAEVDRLRAFKDWVHGYLDQHGVPHHPPGTHGAEGCRIGDRMDWLIVEMDRLQACERDADRLRDALNQLRPLLARKSAALAVVADPGMWTWLCSHGAYIWRGKNLLADPTVWAKREAAASEATEPAGK